MSIWSLVEKREEHECWPWLGPVDKDGYGVYSQRNKKLKAHREIYKEFYGDTSLYVLHNPLCWTRRCCNPRHLRAGTQYDNMQDREYKVGPSGVYGVHKRKSDRWIAYAGSNNTRIHLYSGKDFFEACCARKSWEAQNL